MPHPDAVALVPVKLHVTVSRYGRRIVSIVSASILHNHQKLLLLKGAKLQSNLSTFLQYQESLKKNHHIICHKMMNRLS